MDRQIINRFNDCILQEAMKRYGINKHLIKPLDAFESFIYEFENDGDNFILRISHSLHRTEELIQGEADWINYLARSGVSVAHAILSANNKLVEVIDDGEGGHFLVTAFVRAEGKPPWETGWTKERYESYGELLGKMHALSQDYKPLPGWKRPEWDDARMNFVRRYLPKSEVITHQKYQTLLKHIYSLPNDKESYGLIHQDAHQNNFFMDSNGKLTLFDFDDCAYSWFVNDIAIVLFYISMDAQKLGYPTVAAFTQEFMTHFLKGYNRVYTLDSCWLKEIPYFLKLRELELYAVIHRDFNVREIEHWSKENSMQDKSIDIKNEVNIWIVNFMRDRKFKIEQGFPFIDFDFESLGK